MTLTSHYDKFNQKNMTKLYQNRLGFVEDMTKQFWCFFQFTV